MRSLPPGLTCVKDVTWRGTYGMAASKAVAKRKAQEIDNPNELVAKVEVMGAAARKAWACSAGVGLPAWKQGPSPRLWMRLQPRPHSQSLSMPPQCLAAANQLAQLVVPELQAFLALKGLKKTGNKPDLVARIAHFLDPSK